MILLEDFRSIFDELIPEELPTWKDAICKNLYIPKENTYWEIWQTPFFNWAFEMLENPEVYSIGFMIGIQTGKSQFMANVALEFARRFPNTKTIYYTPDDKLAKVIAADKLIPCLEASPFYSKNLKRNNNKTVRKSALTQTKVEFLNKSTIEVLGVGGKSNLIARSGNLVIVDEYAKMAEISKKKGDVLELASGRTTRAAYNRKVLIASTPEAKGETISEYHARARQYTWEVPCPHCGEFQYLDFGNLKWERPEGMSRLYVADLLKSGRIEAKYVCPHCSGEVKDGGMRSLMLNHGRAACVGNADKGLAEVCLHLNGLYSLEKFNVLAAKYEASRDDEHKDRVFQCDILAAPYEVSKKVESLKIESIVKGTHRKGTVPANSYKLFSGLDVQHNRFYHVTLSYNLDKSISLVDWSEEPFNLQDPLDPLSFPYILQNREFVCLDTGEIKYTDAIVIDSGDGLNFVTLKQLAATLNNGIAIKGKERNRYAGQIWYKSPSKDFANVSKYDSNEFLEHLINCKKFLVPEDIDPKDTYFTHLANVVRRIENGKEVYKDKYDKARRDYRDGTRYALAYIVGNSISEELDLAALADERARNAESILDQLAQLGN